MEGDISKFSTGPLDCVGDRNKAAERIALGACFAAFKSFLHAQLQASGESILHGRLQLIWLAGVCGVGSGADQLDGGIGEEFVVIKWLLNIGGSPATSASSKLRHSVTISVDR